MRDRQKMHPYARVWTQRVRKSLSPRPTNPSRPRPRASLPPRNSPASYRLRDLEGIPSDWRPWFRDTSTGRAGWLTFPRSLFGLPMSPAAAGALCSRCTGLRGCRTTACARLCLACGRRAGKRFILALIAARLVLFKDWAPLSAPVPCGLHKSFEGTILKSAE